MKTTNPTYRSLTIFATYYSIFMCASVSLGTFLAAFRSLRSVAAFVSNCSSFFLAIWFVVVTVVVIVVFFSVFARLFSSLMNSVALKTRTLSLIRLNVARNGRLVVFLPFLYLSCIHSSSLISSAILFLRFVYPLAISFRLPFIITICS